MGTKISDVDAEKLALKALENFEVFCLTCFHIRRKDGSIGPLVLNNCQRRVLEVIKQQQTAGQPIRLVIGKARQLGVSTLWAARFLWRAIRDTNLTGVILADTKDRAKLLLSIVQFGYRHLPSWFVEVVGVQAQYETKYDISFAHTGSQLIISSADSKEPGRAGTIQLLQLSEAAFYEKPEDLTRALFAAVPDLSNTEIVIESTGNGPNWFQARFDIGKRPGSLYASVFLPWFIHEEYKIPGMLDNPDEEEQRLLQVGATPENLLWRRRKIAEDYEGDPSRFRLEFPSTEAEMWTILSASFFDPDVIQKRMLELETVHLHEGFIVPSGSVYEFVPAVPGNVWIKEFPQPGRVYVIGADVGSGVAREDSRLAYSSADVLDVSTGEQVAHLHERAETAVFAQHLEWLGRYYNCAMIAVEVTGGHGLAVLNDLRDAGYPQLYRRREYDRVLKQWQDVLGWHTSPRTKQMILDELRADFRQGTCTVNVKATLEEMLSFVEHEKGGLEAVSGAHDDRVMSLAIANHVRRECAAFLVPQLGETQKPENDDGQEAVYERKLVSPHRDHKYDILFGGVGPWLL